jgi:TrwC relaxase
VRFTVTALGSAGDRPVGVVVGTIARYLIAPEQRPEAPGGPAPERPAEEGSVSRYYADRGDSPGRWLGLGARELYLHGSVDLDAFTTVLAGRDPRTGQRLITAQGSAGRVVSLGSGTAARWSPQGEALYSVRDAARVLGWSQADVHDAIADGERLVASRLVETIAGRSIPAETAMTGPPEAAPGRGPGRDRDTVTGLLRPGRGPDANRDDPGMALVPFIDRDGTRYVTDRELTRVEDLARRGVPAEEVLKAGDPADELSILAAARLVVASPSYLARLCRSYLGSTR